MEKNKFNGHSNYNVLSLFSGGGLLDMGFLNNSFNINQAAEINTAFIECYNTSITNYTKSVNGSTGKYCIIQKPLDLSSKVVQKELKLRNEGIEGLIGGPPCQDYSVGGKNAGVNGERGKLILSYLAVVKKVKPQFLFFENVAGLYNTKNHQSAFLKLVKELSKAGYEVWYSILNSLEYGIPQDRPRLTLVGFKKSIVQTLKTNGYRLDKNDTTYTDDLIFRWPEKIFENAKKFNWPKKWTFGSEIIEDEINLIPEEYSALMVSTVFQGLNESFPNHDEYFVPRSQKFNEIQEGDTNRKSFKRLHRYRYSPTVAYGNNEVHLHPTEPRRLSVREALRLQAVPDQYVLPAEVSLTQKFKLISNGVPVKKSEFLAKEIKRTMDIYNSLI